MFPLPDNRRNFVSLVRSKLMSRNIQIPLNWSSAMMWFLIRAWIWLPEHYKLWWQLNLAWIELMCVLFAMKLKLVNAGHKRVEYFSDLKICGFPLVHHNMNKRQTWSKTVECLNFLVHVILLSMCLCDFCFILEAFLSIRQLTMQLIFVNNAHIQTKYSIEQRYSLVFRVFVLFLVDYKRLRYERMGWHTRISLCASVLLHDLVSKATSNIHEIWKICQKIIVLKFKG